MLCLLTRDSLIAPRASAANVTHPLPPAAGGATSLRVQRIRGQLGHIFRTFAATGQSPLCVRGQQCSLPAARGLLYPFPASVDGGDIYPRVRGLLSRLPE